jgi:anti-anti-sigma factor
MSTNPPEVPASRLKVQVASAEGTTVVHCCGKLTAEVSAGFKEQVKGLIPSAKQLVLDLSEVTYMDSSGLAAIVGLYVSAKVAGCDLRLINLTPKIRQLFAMTRVLSVFESTGQYFIKMP